MTISSFAYDPVRRAIVAAGHHRKQSIRILVDRSHLAGEFGSPDDQVAMFRKRKGAVAQAAELALMAGPQTEVSVDLEPYPFGFDWAEEGDPTEMVLALKLKQRRDVPK